MSDADDYKEHNEDVETALLDADLFVKYKAPHKAIKRLRSTVEHYPRSIKLRERLREIAVYKHPEEAARQCLALANLYIAREDFEAAYERLLEAKQLDPRISITPGLEAIRRARRPDLQPSGRDTDIQASSEQASSEEMAARSTTLAGDLAAISIFDAVQVIENARMTGALNIQGSEKQGRILFNHGRIVGATSGEVEGQEAFRRIVETTSGAFDFEKTAREFPVTINTASNTNLILDSLRQLDEDHR